MSPPKRIEHPAGRYDRALHYARDQRLPSDCPRPLPTKFWPPENVTLLVRYSEWLSGGGASEQVIRTIYLPMAGHILGLALKPHPQLDLERDLQPALDYVQAKGAGPHWTNVSRNAMLKFRRFLLHERGQVECKLSFYEPKRHTEGLPEWLVEELERYLKLSQRNWRPARLEGSIHSFWNCHLRVWRFLCEQCGVQQLSDVRRKHLHAFVESRLEAGAAVSGINLDLHRFTGFLIFLQGQDYPVPQALLRLKGLKEPERLPKHLTDEQVRLLREDFERRVQDAQQPYQQRDALLDRAVFYLLWHGALRRGEVEELRLEDLDLGGRRLSVRNGKGLKDRTIYLTDAAVRALREYLARRGSGPTDHVFLYRNQPDSKDLIHARLKAAGERVGVHVHAHRLRHTTATQLLNAGCPVTSIQKFLGHKKLNTTMIYARAHDQTVEVDYFAAMGRVEARLSLGPAEEEPAKPVEDDQRQELLALAEQLSQPEISTEQRLALAQRIRVVLVGEPVCCELLAPAPPEAVQVPWPVMVDHPPPS